MNREQTISESRNLCKKYFSEIDTSALALSDMFKTACKFRQRAFEETKNDTISQIVYKVTSGVVCKYGIENNKR